MLPEVVHFSFPNLVHYVMPIDNYADPPTKADAVVLFIENTHIEVLEAKRIMDDSGFKKANFVSFPSHMRRIKMITDHVFQQKNSAPYAYQINFVPLRAEPSLPKASPWDLKNIGNVVYEYIKMAWFFSGFMV